jgi:signal transduction histidine kinase
MLTVLLFFIASFGLAFAVVCYRADPQRLDNRLFACIGTTDAITAALRAFLLSQGYALSDNLVLRANIVTQTVITVMVTLFAYSFPFSRPMPRRGLAGTLAFGAWGLSFAFLPDSFQKLVTFVYFMPGFAVIVFLLVQNYRRVHGSDASAVRWVMIALGLRWVVAELTYAVARPLGLDTFRAFLTCESTAAVMASQILIGYSVLAGHLFRVRGLLAEVTLLGSFALAVGTATVASIEAVLAWAPSPIWMRSGLFAAALLPAALFAIARRFRGRLELAILGPLDPRRAEREQCLDAYVTQAERQATPAVVRLAADTIGQIARGGQGRVLAAPGQLLDGASGVLDERLLPALQAEPMVVHLHSLDRVPDDAAAAFRALGYSLAVPVRSRGELVAALVCSGGYIDRDSIVTAITLARHLGLRLENDRLTIELEESKRLAALGAFAAAIAHDIRTPLTSVQMNVQILRGKARLPADDMEHFDIALDELRRLNRHISELLDYAKPVKLAPVSSSPRELAEEAARTIAPELAARAIELNVEHGETPAVLADGARIRQVLLNLLDNAANASARGSAVTLRTAATGDGRVALEVADRGKGIEPADLPRIFEPFYTTRPDGTGLGLAIVQKLVRAHQGEVTVRSTPGQGATFTVLLPAAASGHVS